jgi:hypothetical protein
MRRGNWAYLALLHELERFSDNKIGLKCSDHPNMYCRRVVRVVLGKRKTRSRSKKFESLET